MGIASLSTGTPALGDQVPFNSVANGEDRKCSISSLADLLSDQLDAATSLVTQYYAPNATGWSITVVPTVSGGSIWLLLTPAATYAAGTITLPLQAACTDGQEVLVTCTQIVTALTVAGSGSVVNGAPTTFAANAAFRLRFDGISKAWYRIS